MSLSWDLHFDRNRAYSASRENARILHEWLNSSNVTDAEVESLGFFRGKGITRDVAGIEGTLSPFEVHSVRPARRISPDGEQVVDLIVDITQSWTPLGAPPQPKFWGGCTLLIDLEALQLRYCIRKRVDQPDRINSEKTFRAAMSHSTLRGTYFDDLPNASEPFAMRHRGA
jgi:hypothetical protein